LRRDGWLGAVLFARRMLRFPEVQSLEIELVRSTATLRYRASPGNPQALVYGLADALTDDEALAAKLPPWRLMMGRG